MPTYYDSQNNAHALAERIGSGGEGTVYFSAEDLNVVAKIYHEPITEEKAEKLRWMAANKNERLLRIAAWVVDVLKDAPDGKVVGFLMPSVKAKEIHELYSLKSRRVYFPEATWHFLVHTAVNVARAFYNLHRDEHVMGDVNHGNCVVLADGTVKLIDCDSYSVKTDKLRYHCEVGVGTHLAPELQGANLSEVERETKHDNFGLAVIIFQLLFLGRHPFAGNYLGGEDKSIEDCIRELRFAYGDGAEHRSVKQPPGTLPLNAVSPRVALMFERAFLTEDRPEPREWIEALEDLSNNLEQCVAHPGHLYFNGLAACPFCDIESQTGLMLFPFVTTGVHPGGEKPFNVFTVENLIANLGISQNLPAKPPPPAALPPPTGEVVEARKQNRKYLYISLTAQFFGLIFLMAVIGIGIATFFGICSLIFWLFFTNNSIKYLREDIEETLSEARQKWTAFETEWTRNALPVSLDGNVTTVRQKVADFQKFQQSNIREAKILQDEITKRELFQHLRANSVANAEIEGLGKQEKQWLIGKDINTAAEITESRIRGFNDFKGEIIPKLLEWREAIEREFAHAPRPNNYKEEQENFIKTTARERRRLEREIEHSLTILRSGAVNLRRRQQQLSQQATELAKRLAQANSNAVHLGTNAPAVIGLVLITFVTPYIGFIVKQVKQPRGNTSLKSTYPPPPVNNKYPKTKPEVPDEDITDAEIALLSGDKRRIYADNLYSLVTENVYTNSPDYKAAEKQMRLAVRLNDEEPNLLNELGHVLYEQGKYNESLKYLNQSLKLNQKNNTTKIYIGINYIRQNRLNEARNILLEVTKENPDSFIGQFNLGFAYMKLKNYESARIALEKAVSIGKDDIDTHYQLGICYDKLGKTDKAEAEYEKLLDLDGDKADKLLEETKITPREEIIQGIDEASPSPPDRYLFSH